MKILRVFVIIVNAILLSFGIIDYVPKYDNYGAESHVYFSIFCVTLIVSLIALFKQNIKSLRILALVLNFIGAAIVIALIIVHDYYRIKDLIGFVLAILILNLIVLFLSSGFKGGWLGMYFKRKALAEQVRIEALKEKLKKDE